MKNKIRIAIVGVGNCASSLIQCLQYYRYNKDNNKEKDIIGLMHYDIGGYQPSDITVVSAFDIDRRKVRKSLSRAIFSEPNCTEKIWNEYSFDNDINEVMVEKGPVLDSVSEHMKDYFQIDNSQKSLSKEEIITVLKERKTEVLISYLPVGSQKSTEFWAEVALDAEVAFINCIPVFIASDKGWAKRFEQANLPILGDDIKSQVGSTIVSRYITQMLIDRGARIDSIYQTNIGGNTDFRNMLDMNRLKSKKISKTESISSLLSNYQNDSDQKPYIFAGPSGCVDSLNDNKISYMRFDFKICGNVSCSIDIKLNVQDSPNSSGTVIDAIRIVKIALDRNIGGVLLGPSAWMMKHPIVQYSDNMAKQMTEDFITSNI